MEISLKTVYENVKRNYSHVLYMDEVKARVC